MLITRNLYSGYTQNYVLKDINIEIEERLFVGIIGKNGSGKSTLIKSISGLMPFVKGEILYNDVSLLKGSYADIVSYIPQFDMSLFGFSVYEILKMSQKSYNKFFCKITDIERDRLEDIIEKFELKEIIDRSIFSLSGGEKRRVMIARGVAQNSRIILLDEPLSGLDIDHQVKVFRILKEISESGRIVIASVHDLNMAAQFCDKILLLNKGKIVKYGSIEEVLTYHNIKNTFGVDVYVGINELNNKRFLIPFN